MKLPPVKPDKSSPTWIERTHARSDEAGAELAGLLGFDAVGTGPADDLARAKIVA